MEGSPLLARLPVNKVLSIKHIIPWNCMKYSISFKEKHAWVFILFEHYETSQSKIDQNQEQFLIG